MAMAAGTAWAAGGGDTVLGAAAAPGADGADGAAAVGGDLLSGKAEAAPTMTKMKASTMLRSIAEV